MKLWPWSALETQRQQILRLEAQLNACHMAATGAFHGFPKVSDPGPAYKNEPRPKFQAQIDPYCWSPALTEIMHLIHVLDQYPEPPPGRHAPLPPALRRRPPSNKPSPAPAEASSADIQNSAPISAPPADAGNHSEGLE